MQEDHAKAQLLWGKIHSQPEHLKLICSEQSCTNLFGGAAFFKQDDLLKSKGSVFAKDITVTLLC